MNKQKLFLAALLALLMGVTTACNTIQGVGRDIESAGGAIEDAADGDNDD